MLAQHSRSSKLAFGPFEFDPESRELFRHGSRVRLALQPGTILDALVDRPGELVTREDLRNRLWPGVTPGDFDHGLNAAVNKLRQTLGDVANTQQNIFAGMFEDWANDFLALSAELLNALRKIDCWRLRLIAGGRLFHAARELPKIVSMSTPHIQN